MAFYISCWYWLHRIGICNNGSSKIVWILLMSLVMLMWNANAQVNSGGEKMLCPPKCSCLGEFIQCRKQLTVVPLIPNWCTTLDLSQNFLNNSGITNVRNLPGLTILKINRNQLKEFPVFYGLNYLEDLFLTNNKIEVISTVGLNALPRLKNLDLTRNVIKRIHPETFTYPNKLQFLTLNNNQITILEHGAFENLVGLIELKINHNKLRQLAPRVFRNLFGLKRMELNGNKLSSIPLDLFEGLPHLQVLRIRNNKITDIKPSVFRNLSSLFVLELNHNALTRLSPHYFADLSILASLSLSHNQIQYIDRHTWLYSQQLVTLDVSFNEIEKLTEDSFESLSQLKELNLCGNKITEIQSSTFNSTPALEALDLSYNQISMSQDQNTETFIALSNLDKLFLAGNNITTVSQLHLSGLHRLSILDLNSNNITGIQFGSFDKMSRLQELHINSTKLNCDCYMSWFLSWTYNFPYAGNHVNAICEEPEHLNGIKFKTLRGVNFTCHETPIPRITEEPQSAILLKGSNNVLKCTAISSSSNPLRFQWKKDNFDIVDTKYVIKMNYTIVDNTTTATATLHLFAVTGNNSGRYQCVVSNKFGSAYSQRIKISVGTNPQFTKVPKNATMYSGQLKFRSIKLECAAKGEPTPQISWQKDGGNDFPAARERRMEVMPNDDEFFITNYKLSDMGVYTCIAENMVGIVKTNATVTIWEPPSFVKPMENKEVIVGDSSVIECMASGWPKPTLQWYKDDAPIEITERHFFAAEAQLLIIVKTQSSDDGIYKCVMENSLGTSSGLMRLQVISIFESGFRANNTTLVIIITIVLVAVCTSVAWVCIIYYAKKQNFCVGSSPPSRHHHVMHEQRLFYKNINNTIQYGESHEMPHLHPYMKTETDWANEVPNTAAGNELPDEDRSSCKDSGTGDSAKPSNSLNDINVIADNEPMLLHPRYRQAQVVAIDVRRQCDGASSSMNSSPIFKPQSSAQADIQQIDNRDIIKCNTYNTLDRTKPSML